jgi:cold shock CspA family protein
MRQQGRVKWFSDAKGYGFIVPDSGGEDCFVHISSLDGASLREGDRVLFEIQDSSRGRGKQAYGVEVIP